MWEKDSGKSRQYAVTPEAHNSRIRPAGAGRELLPEMDGRREMENRRRRDAKEELELPDVPEMEGKRIDCAARERGRRTEDDKGNDAARQLYPAARVKTSPPPRVNTGEEHLLFMQILLCAVFLAFVLFARSAGAPFLEDLRGEYRAMMTQGTAFPEENVFARFANGIVEDLRMGADNLLETLERAGRPEHAESVPQSAAAFDGETAGRGSNTGTPQQTGDAQENDAASTAAAQSAAVVNGQGGFWPWEDKEKVPDGASLDDYTLAQTLLQPVYGVLTSGFGARSNPVNGEDDFHMGIDIAAAEGVPVRAALDGQVVKASCDLQRGYYVIVRHADGVQTLYQHLSYIFVRSGETVEKGQTLALVGSTGLVTGPHLHLELILDGLRVDPLPSFPELAKPA